MMAPYPCPAVMAYCRRKAMAADESNDEETEIEEDKAVKAQEDIQLLLHPSQRRVDTIDRKCVYLFRRHRDDCQLINSKDDSLILTGPTRGLVLVSPIYFEVDLRIKDERLRGKKKEHSRGLFLIGGIQSRRNKVKNKVESETFDGKLGTVEMKYAVVEEAVEATVEIKVLEGYFHGEVAACTTNIQDRFVLLDSRTCCVMADNHDLQLSRRVIAVHYKEKLLLTFVDQDDIVSSSSVTQTIVFTPNINGSEVTQVTCGSVKMVVKIE
uniref:DUF6598 domain-containing protein n=1 Tax=Leersia perrieri TaxID=77586 RepID=A0A0D9WBX5_9ORYZ